jgi:hypothetical protein
MRVTLVLLAAKKGRSYTAPNVVYIVGREGSLNRINNIDFSQVIKLDFYSWCLLPALKWDAY